MLKPCRNMTGTFQAEKFVASSLSELVFNSGDQNAAPHDLESPTPRDLKSQTMVPVTLPLAEIFLWVAHKVSFEGKTSNELPRHPITVECEPQDAILAHPARKQPTSFFSRIS